MLELIKKYLKTDDLIDDYRSGIWKGTHEEFDYIYQLKNSEEWGYILDKGIEIQIDFFSSQKDLIIIDTKDDEAFIIVEHLLNKIFNEKYIIDLAIKVFPVKTLKEYYFYK